ncbi:hypothetical protein BGX34_007568 [Mortierella sp. NVP85]|nr:hypothetical protein BGX34_007568 [Mortierella sp. NVP85]
MAQRTLPLECLLDILRVLSQEYDTDTMARLLCVNKTFCVATLPFLYRDCFNTNMHRRSNKSREYTVLQLVRTLLRQVHPQDRIPGLIQAAYLSHDHPDDPQLTAEPPVFKYGHFIHRLAPYPYEKLGNSTTRDSVMRYAASYTLYESYVAEGLFSNIRDDYKNEVLELWFWDSERTHVTQEEQSEHARKREEWYDRLIGAMVHFVQRHTSLHKNVLQRVEVPSLLKDSKSSAVDAQFEIFLLLPPVLNPRSIDISNWCQMATRLSDTNLNFVESINLTLDDGMDEQNERAFKLLNDQPLFLLRCRALKRLAVETLGPEMFHWALLEKKQRDEGHQRESDVDPYLYSREHGYYNDPIPLQSVRIINRAPLAIVQELNDVSFAFSDSLEELVLEDAVLNDWGDEKEWPLIDLAASPQVVYGQGWDLPRLRKLSLQVNHFQLHFDLDTLQRFRCLESLCLEDGVTTYRQRDVWSWPSVSLPHLKKLLLTGSPALRFNMESLHYSPCLEDLAVGVLYIEQGRSDLYHHIPPPEDLESEDSDHDEQSGTPETVSHGYQSIGRRPRWTWDWDLPKLSKLGLDAVFAYKFDFQWLQQLPNLQNLHLDSLSLDRHERLVTMKDLMKGKHQQYQQQKDGDGGQSASDRFISLPKLESIYLDGDWAFEENVMETLCLVVCPNLHSVTLRGESSRPTLREWIALSRMMPHLRDLCVNGWWEHEEILKLGLVFKDELGDNQLNKKRVKYLIDWHTYYDVLES